MIDINVFHISKIELKSRYLENSNSHTVLFRTEAPYSGEKSEFEMKFYGDGASAFSELPRTSDFKDHKKD